MRNIRDWNWDKVGIALSSLCLLHCVLTPVLILSIPTIGVFLKHETFHLLMAFLLLPVTAFAFWHGYRHHHKTQIFVMGIVGILILFVAIWAAESFPNPTSHTVITVLGSLLLISAHIWNRRLCRSTHSCAVHS